MAEQDAAAPAALAASNDTRIVSDVSALVAELATEQGQAKPAPAAKPATKAADPEVEAPADPDAADPGADPDPDSDDPAADTADPDPDDDDDTDPDEPALDDADEDGDEDDVDVGDPDTKQRMESLRRTDARQRERRERERAALESERRALDTERAKFQAETQRHREAFERIQKLGARAKIDPAAVLEAYGLGPEDMEYAAQQVFARSAKAAKDPNYRAAAERAIREREAADKATSAEKRVADLEAKLEAKERQQEGEAQLDRYFRKVLRTATDATPITQKLIANKPKAARRELTVTANELAAKLGRLPKAAEVLEAHERKERRALQLRGITPPARPAKPATGATSEPATAKPATKPATATKAKPVTPAAPAAADKTTAEERPSAIPSVDDLIREIRAGAPGSN